MEITPEQIRAARALLRLEQSELAARAQVSVVTIRRIESANGTARVLSATVEGVRRALETSGAEFIPGGVRWRQAARADAETLFQDLRALSLRGAARLADSDLLTDDDLYDEGGLPA